MHCFASATNSWPGSARTWGAGPMWRWLQSEAQAAPRTARPYPVPTPEPVALGEPGAGYPLPWSVQTWLPGTVATDEDPGESAALAHDLAEFIHGVRAIDTRGRAFDVGGMGPADPALDLVGAWHLLEAGPRQVLRDDLKCEDLEWERGKAWAFEQSMGAVWYYVESNRAMSLMGQRTLQRIMADTSSS
jgi:aminoglycoside phosphotransferase (APT) family kinase protein